ncbi:CAAD domain-containing protein [Leptolyngbya cf. ectocarpi LEGE 11479]|uniref:CAAD domain-containing protein n=1 Tax=Leptolyngbya cf. ectocarpi LEGE 11479 TaxID=1828722 RepID=A0A928ZWR6_LEPEC|nr:CAAD domain-containing protein [Leptolyngbya ectocarpi]MBE9068877.1 CAAD domain-containing protein [Leptolyngbya cf. ectocarpi LEGE 11479]
MSTDINPPEENVTAQSAADTAEQAKEILAKVASVLGDAPQYVVEIFNEYKRPLTVIGLVFGGLIAIKMMFAILAAINDIPVLAPTMELIGLIYTGWFIYRYLLKASNRSELLSSLGTVKDQITGNK